MVLGTSSVHDQTKSFLSFLLPIQWLLCACNSGALGESHVLEGIQHPEDRAAIRISFSKFNEKKEVDLLVKALQKLVAVAA
jgi:selenocysteine lyase/cysteine desulfurase